MNTPRRVSAVGLRIHWWAGGFFAAIGLIFLGIPFLLSAAATDAGSAIGVLRALGAAFLGLGGVILLMWPIGREIERALPQNAPVWEWWVNFVGGVLGAALFAIPATLLVPLMLLLYFDRPNWAYPDPDAGLWPNGYLGLLFGGAGLISLVALVLMGRTSYKSRPRWRR